jgi:hypothetical protein
MSHLPTAYELKEERFETGIQYFFISQGWQDVIKVIQYSFLENLNGRDIFNLGFGDYDIGNDRIIDNINTNNGDPFKVFNTVLSTIPSFFQVYDEGMLMVQGSDGRPEFIENCRLTCPRICGDNCRNFNRRINLYRRYIDKNYATLAIDYQFFGGNEGADGTIILENYAPGVQYDSVFLIRNQ